MALLGWSPGEDKEIFKFEELIEEFSIDKVVKKGAVFDEKKLNWVCGQHLSNKISNELLSEMRELYGNWNENENEKYILDVIDIVKTRVKSLTELQYFSNYFFNDPIDFDEKVVRKRWRDSEVNDLMNRYWEKLHELLSWDSESIEEHLRNFAESEEISAGKLIHPTRIAISGQGVGPSLFDLMTLLGRERVLRRINYAIDNLPLS